MHPLLLQYGEAAVATYSVLFSLAFFVALSTWILRGKIFGLPTAKLVNATLLATLLGWIGSRLFFIVLNAGDFVSGRFSIWRIWEGGLVFYGGLISATLFLWIYLPRVGLPRTRALACLVPGMAWAHAVGRIGCFFNGCCHGKYCTLPWAVRYTDPLSAARPLGVPMHPSQLYEAAGLAILGYILWRQKGHERALWIYLGGYGLLRFFVELTRGDPLRGFWGPLSSGEVLSLVLMITALLLAFRGRKGDNPAPYES